MHLADVLLRRPWVKSTLRSSRPCYQVDLAIRSTLRSGRPCDQFDFAISDADDDATTTRRRQRGRQRGDATTTTTTRTVDPFSLQSRFSLELSTHSAFGSNCRRNQPPDAIFARYVTSPNGPSDQVDAPGLSSMRPGPPTLETNSHQTDFAIRSTLSVTIL